MIYFIMYENIHFIYFYYVQHIKITYFTILYNDELYYFVTYIIYIKMMTNMIPQISGESIHKLISRIRKLSNLMQKYILE